MNVMWNKIVKFKCFTVSVVEWNLFPLSKPNACRWIPIRFATHVLHSKTVLDHFSVSFVLKLLWAIIINIERKSSVRNVLISIGNGKRNSNERTYFKPTTIITDLLLFHLQLSSSFSKSSWLFLHSQSFGYISKDSSNSFLVVVPNHLSVFSLAHRW